MNYDELIALPKRPVTHVSYSQLDKFSTCQLAWYFRHVLGIKKPASLAMVAGTSFHKTMEYYFNNQIAGNAPFDLPELVTYFREELTEQIILNKLQDTDDSKKQAIRDGVINVLGRYYGEHLLNLRAARSEHSCEIDLGNGKNFKAVIDLVLEDGTVVDFKVTKGNFDKKKAATSYQPAAYAMVEGRPVDLQFHVMKWSQVRNPVEILAVTRGARDIEEYAGYARRICAVMDEIVDGALIPQPSDSGCYYCDYALECLAWKNGNESTVEELVYAGFEC